MSFPSAFFTRFLMMIPLVGAASTVHGKEVLARLHVPWPAFENKMNDLLKSSGVIQTSIPDQAINAGGLNWNLTGLGLDAQLTPEKTSFDGQHLSVHFSNLSARILLNRVAVDQVVEREMLGAIARIRVKASCGPLSAVQTHATADVSFDVDWSSGEPSPRLRDLNLQWAPGSWSVENFACEGIANLADILRSELALHLSDPNEFKSMLGDFVGREAQARVQEALAKLKQPLTMPTGQGQLALTAGALTPGASGLLVEVLPAADNATNAAFPAPTAAQLQKLPTDQPTLLGNLATLEFLLKTELAARSSWISMDLSTVSSFKSLLSSRFLQFFVWPDLLNYPKNSPFFLRLAVPTNLSLSRSGDNLTSRLPIQAYIQSQRDGQWWNSIGLQGTANATVTCGLNEGVMTYATSLSRPSLAIGYTASYLKQYGSPGWLPTSSLQSAFEGSQSGLSGSMTWPDLDVGLAGKYRARTLQWVDTNLFTILWKGL